MNNGGRKHSNSKSSKKSKDSIQKIPRKKICTRELRDTEVCVCEPCKTVEVKGTNVTSKSLDTPQINLDHKTSTDGRKSPLVDKRPKTVEEMRSEINQVIEGMEPKTPVLPLTESEQPELIKNIEQNKSDLTDLDTFSDSFSLNLEPCQCTDKMKQIQVVYERETNKHKKPESQAIKEPSLADYEQSSEHQTLDNFQFNFPIAPTTTGGQPPCICPFNYAFQYPVKNGEHESRQKKFKLQKFYEWLGKRSFLRQSNEKIPVDLYKMNFKAPRDDTSPPRQLIFDLVQEIPKPETNTVATNTKQQSTYYETTTNSSTNTEKQKAPVRKDSDIYMQDIEGDTNKVDVYYFDHGNSAYFRTTDASPMIFTELLAERTEKYTTKFWANVFGTVHIGFSFVTSFIVQLIRFWLVALFRPLIIGTIQTISDYFFKPCLTVIFNGALQPPLVFMYNCCTSVRDIFYPIAEGLGYFTREIAVVFKSIRLIEWSTKANDVDETQSKCIYAPCPCKSKSIPLHQTSDSEEDNEKV